MPLSARRAAFWLACLCLASPLEASRILGVVDPAGTTSSLNHFWASLRSAGFDVVVGDVQESAAVLRRDGDSIDHIAFFATGVKQLPAELSPQSLARRLENGVDLLLVAPPPATEVWRDFAREFEVDFDDRESWVADHFAFDPELDSGSHSVLTVPVSNAPTPFISATTRSGPPVVYRGGGHAAGPHPMLTSVLRASPSAISAASGSEGPTEDARMIGSQHALVSAFQARNNARVAFAGSADLFSDQYVESPEIEQPRYGNAGFVKDLAKWTFQQTGQLQIASFKHRLADSVETPAMYTVKTDMHVELDLIASEPYEANDLQLDFTMLDPHLRLPIAVSPTAGNLLHGETRFTIPDRHGVFKLEIDHRRPGWSNVHQALAVPVVPPRHDEYDRFIGGAIPYYGGAASVTAAFILFAWLWTAQS
ncbi:hypothetical protein JCM10908_002303 [Rhodotorula pacifica]|uniref:dolichyl-diphosphooligosaccharide-protein glycotransferase n=1 Tax=Rhodotorula pacifica TaxID=1495444 RepID=UPI00317E31BD